MCSINIAAKAVDIMCMPLYAIGVAVDIATDITNILGENANLTGFHEGYITGVADAKAGRA